MLLTANRIVFSISGKALKNQLTKELPRQLQVEAGLDLLGQLRILISGIRIEAIAIDQGGIAGTATGYLQIIGDDVRLESSVRLELLVTPYRYGQKELRFNVENLDIHLAQIDVAFFKHISIPNAILNLVLKATKRRLREELQDLIDGYAIVKDMIQMAQGHLTDIAGLESLVLDAAIGDLSLAQDQMIIACNVTVGDDTSETKSMAIPISNRLALSWFDLRQVIISQLSTINRLLPDEQVEIKNVAFQYAEDRLIGQLEITGMVNTTVNMILALSLNESLQLLVLQGLELRAGKDVGFLQKTLIGAVSRIVVPKVQERFPLEVSPLLDALIERFNASNPLLRTRASQLRLTSLVMDEQGLQIAFSGVPELELRT